jgi:hypothetical protein
MVIHMTVENADGARFRKQAEEARQHAAKALSPLDKEAWLRVVEPDRPSLPFLEPLHTLKREELAKLKKRGKLSPSDVVEFARDEKTALHSCFEWDDSVAAREYRLHQNSHRRLTIGGKLGHRRPLVRCDLSGRLQPRWPGGHRCYAACRDKRHSLWRPFGPMRERDRSASA